MPTKRARTAAKARDDEEPQFLRGVSNPAGRTNPRRRISRPPQADPVTGNPTVAAVTPSQNPRGRY